LRTDDCRETCAELEARGVELTQQPDERFYGIDAALRDPSGNDGGSCSRSSTTSKL
jgi:hypothetical protein